jgi:hypothetical protein
MIHSSSPAARHREESLKGDEAMKAPQTPHAAAGLLRFARNDA